MLSFQSSTKPQVCGRCVLTGEVNRAARGYVSLGLRPGATSWQALSPPSPPVKGHRGLLFEDGYGRCVLAQPRLRTRTGILGCLRRESDPFSRSASLGENSCLSKQYIQFVQATGKVRPPPLLGSVLRYWQTFPDALSALFSLSQLL